MATPARPVVRARLQKIDFLVFFPIFSDFSHFYQVNSRHRKATTLELWINNVYVYRTVFPAYGDPWHAYSPSDTGKKALFGAVF
jgi:hypothetical protein